MANVIIAMMVHGAATATMVRHLPYWDSLKQRIIFCTPEDDPVVLPGVREVFYPGKQQHSGPVAMERQKRVMLMLSEMEGYDWYMVTEYDTMFLGTKFPEFERGLSGIRNPNYDLKRWRSPWVLGPPWVMDRESLLSILKYADEHPEVVEEGCIDRCLPAWAEGAGVPVLALPKAGLFLNEITPNDFQQMIKICDEGGRFFHGVKTERCLSTLLFAYEPM